MNFKFLLALALLVISTASGVPVEAAPSAPAQPKSVTIKFNPPLNQLIRYRITKTRTRQQDGKPLTSNSASWIEEIRFQRRGADEFLMSWRFDISSLPADQRTPTMLASLAPWGDIPLQVEVDDLGSFERIQNWDDAKARLRASLSALEAQALKTVANSERARLRSTFGSVSDVFLKMDENSAPRAILKNLNSVHGWGGTSFDMGVPSETTSLLPVPFGGPPILTTVRTRLTALDPGKVATVSVAAEADPASLKTFTLALMDQMMKSLPPEKAEEGRKAFASTSMELEDRSKMTFDLPTGQVSAYTNERTMGIPGQGRGSETLKIELVR
jgi:hypothetical protein